MTDLTAAERSREIVRKYIKLGVKFVVGKNVYAEWMKDDISAALATYRKQGHSEGARQMRERAAQTAATFFSPAHTYASENADIYRAQDDAQRRIAEKIRALAEY